METTTRMMVNNHPARPRGESLWSKLNNPAVMLAGAALLSTIIYWFAFVQPANLLELYPQARLDGSTPYWREAQFRWHYIRAFAAQGLLYWLGWRFACKASGKWAWLAVSGGVVASACTLLFLYPFDAADIFDNIVHGRMLGLYGANPLVQIAREYAQDPFYNYMAWKLVPSAYGPLWEIPAAATAALAGDGILANVLAFKLLPIAFLGGSLVWVALILRRMAPKRALAGVLLLGWNPVVLYETSGNGHNDIVMVFWILAAVCALLYKHHSLAILSLIAGTLVKFIPILLVPAAIGLAWRDLLYRGARLRFALTSLITGVTLVGLAYAPFWQGIDTLSISRRLHLFSASLPAFIFQVLSLNIPAEQATSLVGLGAAILTAIFAIWQAWRASHDYTWLSFSRAAFNILIFYLLVTCLWFQQWYTLWPLGLAALLPPGYSVTLGVLFSFTALSKQFIAGPVLFSKRPFPPQPWLELRFAVQVLIIPWLFGIYTAWRTSRCSILLKAAQYLRTEAKVPTRHCNTFVQDENRSS